jgi:hypothetical protein
MQAIWSFDDNEKADSHHITTLSQPHQRHTHYIVLRNTHPTVTGYFFLKLNQRHVAESPDAPEELHKKVSTIILSNKVFDFVDIYESMVLCWYGKGCSLAW